jgi:hypothetical protein
VAAEGVESISASPSTLMSEVTFLASFSEPLKAFTITNNGPVLFSATGVPQYSYPFYQ